MTEIIGQQIMAILIRGTTVCRICFKVIESGQAAAAFTSFVPNELDPLRFFNDRAFHTQCFNGHPLSGEVLRRLSELEDHNGPGHRFCVVCKQEILHDVEYLSLGHLTNNPEDPAFAFNYLQFHRKCLSGWPDINAAYEICNCSRA